MMITIQADRDADFNNFIQVITELNSKEFISFTHGEVLFHSEE